MYLNILKYSSVTLDFKCSLIVCVSGGAVTSGPTCRFDQFQCYRGGSIHCIYQSWVCDGERDCEMGEDEVDCDSRF